MKQRPGFGGRVEARDGSSELTKQYTVVKGAMAMPPQTAEIVQEVARVLMKSENQDYG